MKITLEDTIKRGICFYSEAVNFEVRIVKGDIIYGSGDCQDTCAISNDQKVQCYNVWYECLGSKDEYSGGGQYLALKDAVNAVQKSTMVRWL